MGCVVAGNITWCTPKYGPVRGGFLVTILGTNLGNGNDILNVSLNGQYSPQILSQSSSSVVFVAPACSPDNGCFPNEGDVVVTSVSYGTTVRYRLFQYHDDDGARFLCALVEVTLKRCVMTAETSLCRDFELCRNCTLDAPCGDCPLETPFRCASGHCVINQTLCAAPLPVCPRRVPFRCENQQCNMRADMKYVCQLSF